MSVLFYLLIIFDLRIIQSSHKINLKFYIEYLLQYIIDKTYVLYISSITNAFEHRQYHHRRNGINITSLCAVIVGEFTLKEKLNSPHMHKCILPYRHFCCVCIVQLYISTLVQKIEIIKNI